MAAFGDILNMILPKKSKPAKETATDDGSMNSNVLTLRGQMVAASRFKTWCCLFLFVIVIFQCFFIGSLIGQKKIIVGINSSGVPELLQSATAEMSLDMYVRDFVSRFFTFSPTSVRQNMEYASTRITPTLAKVYERSMGPQYFQSVTDLGVVQITTVRNVAITDLTDSGFNALVTVGRLKSDNVERQTVEQTVYISLKVVRGAITPENPWGYYVDEVRESLTRPRQ